MTLDERAPRVTTLEITYDCVKGWWDENETAVILSLTGVGSEEWSQAFISTQDGQTKEIIKLIGEASQVYVYLRSSFDDTSPYDLGSMILWKVEMKGNGVDPFSGRITS